METKTLQINSSFKTPRQMHTLQILVVATSGFVEALHSVLLLVVRQRLAAHFALVGKLTVEECAIATLFFHLVILETCNPIEKKISRNHGGKVSTIKDRSYLAHSVVRRIAHSASL